MQSPCSEIADMVQNTTQRRLGFTLLELIIVVALLGLMAGVVGVRVASGSQVSKERSALDAMVTVLATTRVEGMRTTGASQCVTLAMEGGQLVLSAPGQRRELAGQGLRLIDATAEPMAGVEACFDGAGRTTERIWWFMSETVNRTELLNAELLKAPWDEAGSVRRNVQGQVWRIVFDPVSGSPRVERVDRVEGA
jgi:prepilin-type N-terminal cleavage/methylation domain-containing protein